MRKYVDENAFLVSAWYSELGDVVCFHLSEADGFKVKCWIQSAFYFSLKCIALRPVFLRFYFSWMLTFGIQSVGLHKNRNIKPGLFA